MSRILRSAGLVASTTIAFAAAGLAQSGTGAGPFKITGTVTADGGAPIAGASVVLTDRTREEVGRTTTDTRGKYGIWLPVPDTVVLVRFQTTGYVTVNVAFNANTTPSGVLDMCLPKALRTTECGHAKPTGVVTQSYDVSRGSTLVPKSSFVWRNVVERAQLGPADAIDITLQRGRIVVVGKQAGDTSQTIVYQMRKDVTGTRRDSLLLSPTGLPGYDGKVTRSFGPNGMVLAVRAEDVQGNDGVDLRLELPRNLKLLKLTMQRGGQITVEDFDGELSIKNDSGPVHIAYLSGPALVETGNGEITATIKSTYKASPISFLARSGDISLILDHGEDADFDVETRKGMIASTPSLDGSVDNLPGTRVASKNYPDRLGPHRATGRMGSGGPLIRIVTLQGDVDISRWDVQGVASRIPMPRWAGDH